MGLCLGFSGLSAMEVLYFLTLRAWCRTRRRRAIGARVAQKFRDVWIKVKRLRAYVPQAQTIEESNANAPNPTRVFQNTIEIEDVERSHSTDTPRIETLSTNTFPLPAVSISETILKKKNPFDHTMSLPSYNNILDEIGPFYLKRY